jgi:hypothetical protein
MDLLYFIVKYTPFWSIPMIIISVSTCYLLWIKDVRKLIPVFVVAGAVSFIFLVFWIWAGGPDRSVQELQVLLNSF